MPIDWSLFAISKGTPLAVEKRDRRLDRATEERVCREAVKRRDKGRCVVPGCKDASDHLHHITYRSKGGKWRTGNICSLCASHHAMVHAGKIDITGNADEELTIHGSRKDLSFKL